MKASIVILNYFGEKTISSVIDSILNSRGKVSFEIVVVDNNSQDRSIEIIKKYVNKFPQEIKLIINNDNKGFSAGNNIGIKHSSGEFIVLLNNDCVVDADWLENLIKTFSRNKKIFAVNSKILLYPKYFYLPLEEQAAKVTLLESKILDFSKETLLVLPIQQSKKIKYVEVPIDPNDKNISLKIDDNISKINVEDIKTYSKIQNAGSVVFQDGYGRDIGSLVKNHTQNYETDSGQYNKEREVYSICGAAVAFRKKILEKIGLLDESFFMYYEDTEISERARLCGYINFYQPKAVVRHLHAFSSKEWSPFFIYHVEKGRLLHSFLHFPTSKFMLSFSQFFIQSMFRLIKHKENYSEYIRVVFFFVMNLLLLLHKRVKYGELYNDAKRRELYSSIISGYWYEN